MNQKLNTQKKKSSNIINNLDHKSSLYASINENTSETDSNLLPSDKTDNSMSNDNKSNDNKSKISETTQEIVENDKEIKTDNVKHKVSIDSELSTDETFFMDLLNKNNIDMTKNNGVLYNVSDTLISEISL